MFFLTMVSPVFSQDNTVVLKRTPEQEAAKQTERLQQELNLSSEQTNQIYEINLRYARERQISNKRSEAVERMKNKNIELGNVLNEEQNNKLQMKRYQRSTIEIQSINHNQPMNSSGFRTSGNFRPSTNNLNQYYNNRPVNPNFQNRNQPNQTTFRTSPSNNRPIQNQNNSSLNHRSTNISPNVQRRTSTSIQQDNSSTRQSSPTPPSRRTDAPVNTNRR